MVYKLQRNCDIMCAKGRVKQIQAWLLCLHKLTCLKLFGEHFRGSARLLAFMI